MQEERASVGMLPTALKNNQPIHLRLPSVAGPPNGGLPTFRGTVFATAAKREAIRREKGERNRRGDIP